MRHWYRSLLPLAVFLLPMIPLKALSEDLSLTAYKGRVVYLDFWASWCTPCKLSFPWMNALQRSYADKGLVVIAVNMDHDHALANRFLQDTPAQFNVVYDPDGHIAEKFDVKDMPTSILIGRDGSVHYVHSGFTENREGEYLAHVNALLAGGK